MLGSYAALAIYGNSTDCVDHWSLLRYLLECNSADSRCMVTLHVSRLTAFCGIFFSFHGYQAAAKMHLRQ